MYISVRCSLLFFFFNDTATTEIYTLSLHDALPICLIKMMLVMVSLGTVRHPRRFKIVVIDIQITLKQMLRDFIGIRVNQIGRAVQQECRDRSRMPSSA